MAIYLFHDIKEPLIKSFLNTLSDGFSSVGNDACGFNQRFLKKTKQYEGKRSV